MADVCTRVKIRICCRHSQTLNCEPLLERIQMGTRKYELTLSMMDLITVVGL